MNGVNQSVMADHPGEGPCGDQRIHISNSSRFHLLRKISGDIIVKHHHLTLVKYLRKLVFFEGGVHEETGVAGVVQIPVEEERGQAREEGADVAGCGIRRRKLT